MDGSAETIRKGTDRHYKHMTRVGNNGSLGMGIAFVLEDYFSDTAQHINQGMENLSVNTERFANRAQESFGLIITGAAMVGTALAGLTVFKKASDVRAEFQSYEVQFETLLKSAEKASDFMSKIKQDAIDNPVFGTEALVAGNAALIATGNVNEEASRRITNNLAEVLAGAGKGNDELMRMSANLQQIGNTGKATAMDIKQFGMAGIPIYKLLGDSMGKSQEEVAKMDISLDQLDKAFAHAISSQGMFAGAAERAAASTKGLKAALEDGVELTLERIGKAIEPITRKIYTVLGDLMDRIMEFVTTPFGQRVTQWVAAALGLLAVSGLLLTVYGASRLALFKLIGMFAATTKATILQTLATRGLSAGLREMGRAAWASLGPYIAIVAVLAVVALAMWQTWELITKGSERMAQLGVAIGILTGPIGWLVTLVAGLYRGFEELRKPMDKMATSGVLGFFTKLAAGVETVRQVWRTWNGESAELTEDLYMRLEKLGMVSIAEKLIAVTARLRQFWDGLKSGIAPIAKLFDELKTSLVDKLGTAFDLIIGKVKNIFGKLGEILKPLMPLIKGIFEKLFGDMSGLDKWQKLGHIFGVVITVGAKLAFQAIKDLVDVILWVVKAIFTVIEFTLDMYIAVRDTMVGIHVAITSTIDKVIKWLTNKAATFVAAGVLFVTSIKSGIESAWGGLMDTVSSKVDSLVTRITSGLKGAFEFVKTGGGLWGDYDPQNGGDNTTPVGGGNPNLVKPNGVMLQSTKIPHVTNNSTTNNSGGAAGFVPINNQIFLDSNLISETVTRRQTFNSTRND